VGSDGSSDGTDAEVLAADRARVRLVTLPPGTGKTRTVNALAREAVADVLVISDADVLIERDAIRKLAAHFQNPRIGAVCARRSGKAHCGESVGPQARLYNRYESALKSGEGRLGCVLGGNGSLYAIRRELFTELPAGTPDDFVSILRVLEQKQKVVYENEAVSREDLPRSARREFNRRRRTTARAVRGLWSVRSLLNPARFPLVSFLLISHKLLRWHAGLFMAALLLLNLFLVREPRYAWLFAAQAAFYACAALGTIETDQPLWKPFKMARYFVLMNMAATAGIVDVLRGRDWQSWDVTESR
jgi:cellulose synthase/poly-beta-1,6-N-acetylglucosamine synthase-like glycosyltransferase